MARTVRPETGSRAGAVRPAGRRGAWWATVVPTVVTLGVGGRYLGRSSIWTDEAATWRNARLPLGSMVHGTLHTQDAVLLPYYLCMHVWTALGTQAWVLRLPSLLAAAATTGLLTVLARRWLAPGWVLFAGLLLACNPLFVRWSIEARPYALATMFSVLCTGALLDAVERRRRRHWLLYGLWCVGMLLFHLFAVFVLCAQVLAVAVARRAALRPLVVTLVGVGVVTSPLAAVAAGQTAQVDWIPRATPGTFLSALTAIAGGHAPAGALALCALAVALAAGRAPARSARRLRALLVVAWAVVPAALLVATSFAHPLYVDRYLLVSVPGVALAEAMAARLLWERVRAWRAPPRPALVGALGAVAVVTVVVGAPLWLARTSVRAVAAPYYYDDFRSASTALGHELAPGLDALVVVPAVAGQGFAYYSADAGLRDRLLHPVALAFPRLAAAGGAPVATEAAAGLVAAPRGAPARLGALSCADVLVVGRHPDAGTPLPAFSLNGSACRLVGARTFGLVWVARARPGGERPFSG